MYHYCFENSPDQAQVLGTTLELQVVGIVKIFENELPSFIFKKVQLSAKLEFISTQLLSFAVVPLLFGGNDNGN